MAVQIQSSYVLPTDEGPIGKMPDGGVGFWDAFTTTFSYQYRPLADAVAESAKFGSRTYNPEFDPFTVERMAGYEEHLNDIAKAKDDEHLAFIKADIDRRLQDKKTLEEAGFWSGGMWVASLLDPMNVAFALPVFGQLGLMAKGGMTVRQAAAASARGSFVAASTQEAIRAPFDKTNTFTETGLNLAATTAVGTIFGSIPSVARSAIGSARKSAAMRNEVFQNRGMVPEQVDGLEVEMAAAPMPEAPKGKKVDTSEIQGKLNEARKAQASIAQDETRMLAMIRSDASGGDAVLASEAARQGISPAVLRNQMNKEVNSVTAARKNMDQTIKQLEAEIATLNKANAEYQRGVRSYSAKMGLRKPVVIKGKKISVDQELVEQSFNQRPWVSMGFKEADFLTPNEWGDFLILREVERRKTKRKPGSSKEAYDRQINRKAYDRMASGNDLAETPFTRSIAFKLLTTPGKRIMADGTPSMKRAYHLLAGVDQYRTAGVEAGKTQHQSVYRQSKTHVARSITAIAKLEQLWAKDQLGRGLSTKALGFNTDDIVARSKGKQTFDDWFQTVIDARLLKQAGRLTDEADLSPEYKQAMKEVDEFFNQYQKDLQDLNMLFDDSVFSERAKGLRERADNIEKESASTGFQQPTPKQQEFIKKLRDDAEFLDELVAQRYKERYQFPIYYDKVKLLREPEAREKLERIFADWIRTHPVTRQWDDKQRKFIDVDSKKSPEQIAKDAVAAILEEGDDVTFLEMATGAPKGKHLRHRMINIPEHMISDFIVKEPRVLHSYAQRVGRRMEFVRNFGNRNIDEILDDFEMEMRQAGYTEKKIQSLRQDFLFDYERVMGEYVKNPDRWDAQLGKGLKAMAGMSYLDAAALASVTDMGNIVLERGIGKSFLAHRSDIDKALMIKAKAQVLRTGEATELSLGGAQQRWVADNIQGVSPNLQERIFSPIERVYYNIPVLGNGLGALTYWMKQIDGVYRSDYYMDTLIKWANGSAKTADVQYMLRMGFTENDAKVISSYPHEKGDRYIYAAVDKWPASTPEERNIILKWNTAMNAGIGNTILHATSFDKPRVMDGVVYTRYRPWMKTLGLEIDERASSASIKVTRIETQALTLPFQFFNFMLGATNRITAGMLDPMKQHRLVGGVALLGLGYTALHLKQFGNPWWFDSRSNSEVFQRTVDQSGFFGVYGELAYIATHTAIGMGLSDPDDTLLRPKYNPSIGDVITEPLGAAPGMVWAWAKAGKAFFEGDTSEAAKQFEYNHPTTPLIGMAQDWLN